MMCSLTHIKCASSNPNCKLKRSSLLLTCVCDGWGSSCHGGMQRGQRTALSGWFSSSIFLWVLGTEGCQACKASDLLAEPVASPKLPISDCIPPWAILFKRSRPVASLLALLPPEPVPPDQAPQRPAAQHWFFGFLPVAHFCALGSNLESEGTPTTFNQIYPHFLWTFQDTTF